MNVCMYVKTFFPSLTLFPDFPSAASRQWKSLARGHWAPPAGKQRACLRSYACLSSQLCMESSSLPKESILSIFIRYR